MLALATFFGVTSASCFAQALFFAVESSPYDNQMARIRPVLECVNDHCSNPVSLNTVNQMMINLHAIRYRYSQQWKTPTEVKSARVADCKGKAITLYEAMQACGAQNVRFVIGKRRVNSSETHAWVEWETAKEKYVLDPTFNWLAAKAPAGNSKKYIPLYAYEGALRYRVVNMPALARN